jgi:hypothetical protein
MTEVVFGQSACGSLKLAQHYGEGSYPGSAIGVILEEKHPSRKQIREAKKQAEEAARRQWEQAIPLGGNPSDVFCIEAAWSMGEISQLDLGTERIDTLQKLYSIWPEEDTKRKAEETIAASNDALQQIQERFAAGGEIRIWYSQQNPDELCGFYWLLTRLQKDGFTGKIYGVKLPAWSCTEKQVTQYNGWGEISPDQWGTFLPLQRELSSDFIRACSLYWHRLQAENAPLRASVNGNLLSVPASFYDPFILKEIQDQPSPFFEPHVIGKVMGKYQLGISDALIDLRIQRFIDLGCLKENVPAEKGCPSYKRTLEKTADFL